ncbi:MAG: RNA polymerase factor sigma-54 [Eubacteriales bacterium]|nr:RNA polymerase factor sigma-54 [Eubacteriales bacterium]
MALELDIRQQQKITQRTIQSVQILQMSSHELDAYIREQALENPAMDVTGKESSESVEAHIEARAAGEEEHYLSIRQNNDDDYDPKGNWNFNTGNVEKVSDCLLMQLDLASYSCAERWAIDYIVESLDERGYFTEDPAEAAVNCGLTEEEFKRLLSELQALEPAGICAHDLCDCLKIQLKREGLLEPKLEELVDSCLELAAKNKIVAMSKKLRVTPEKADEYLTIIRTLDPKPGSRFAKTAEIRYVRPDVYVTQIKDAEGIRNEGARDTSELFEIELNDAMYPEISVNEYYYKLFRQTDDAELKEYLSAKINQVRWIRQCIEQRNNTLISVTREILECQRDFFLDGPKKLKPLRLIDVAEKTGLHESTISRAANSKYLQCSRGVFPLSYFFKKSAAAHRQGFAVSDNAKITSDNIKNLLKEIVAGENPKKPMSDRLLSEALEQRGVSISRRTVAKYRDEAGIPDASGRKNGAIF